MTTGPTDRLVARTSDYDEAVAMMRNAFGNVELQRDDGAGAGTEFMLHSVFTADLVTSRWTLAGVAGASLDAYDEMESMFLTGLRIGGGARVRSRWEEIADDRPFVYPDRVDAVLDHVDFLNLAVSRSALDARARALTGIDDLRVRFVGTAAVDRAHDVLWRDTMIYAARTMDSLSGLDGIDIAQTGLLDLVASIMLRSFPNTALDMEGRRDAVQAVAPVLRRAVRYIEDHLDQPISVTDIADAARLSTRGLYAAFRRDLETTPMEYLRSARAAAAHKELLAADPGQASVTEIALRWGFTHAGRFAERHRATFGESPTDTLRR